MATAKTVNGKVSGPDNSVRPYARVLIQLSVPTVVVGQQEISSGPVSIAASAVDGTWTASLYANGDLSPANSYYTVTEITDVSTTSYQISVPQTAGPFQASALVTLPSVTSLPAGHVSTLVVDSTATFNGTVAFNAGTTWAGTQVFQSNLDVRGSLVDGAQASGTVGIGIALANVGSVTAETIGFQQAAQTLTLTGGYTPQRFAVFQQPTVSGAFTINTSATVAIANQPNATGGASILNPLALWVQAGSSLFNGGVALNGNGSQPIGVLLDVRAVSAAIGGTSSPGGDALGDKIALWGNAYGLGVQSGRLVLYAAFGGAGVGIRANNLSGGASTGTETFFFATGLPAASTAESNTFSANAQTLTITGGFTTERFNLFAQPTISGAFTVTNAATVAIANAPAAAGGATLTNAYALWVQAGTSKFDALVQTLASASGGAGLNLPHGAAPTSPVNGDIWSTTAGLFIRVNGVTKTVTLT